MNVYRAECVTELWPNNSEPEVREASVGRTYASAHESICNDECVTMNVYRAECVTELGPNNSEPEAREASVGRTYASASTLDSVIKASISRKLRQISKKTQE